MEQQRQLPQGRQARQPALHHVRGRGVRPLRLRQHHQGEDQGDPTAVCLSESQPIQGHLLILYLPGCGDQAAECEEDHEGSEAQARGLGERGQQRAADGGRGQRGLGARVQVAEAIGLHPGRGEEEVTNHTAVLQQYCLM